MKGVCRCSQAIRCTRPERKLHISNFRRYQQNHAYMFDWRALKRWGMRCARSVRACERERCVGVS